MRKWIYIVGVLIGAVGVYRFAKKKGISVISIAESGKGFADGKELRKLNRSGK